MMDFLPVKFLVAALRAYACDPATCSKEKDMRSLIVCLCAGMILTIAHASFAGPPGGNGAAGGPPPDGGGQGPRGGGEGGGGGHRGGPPGQGGNSENMIQQIMALDANGDGGLTPAEVTDLRLQTLLQQADTDSSGSVTLTELTTAMSKKTGQGMGGPGMGGGHGGPGGPSRPGEIMPGFIQDQLQLTDTQRQQLATLQSGVDAQLLQILTTQQIQQLAAGPQNFGNGNGAKGSGRKGRSSKNSQ